MGMTWKDNAELLQKVKSRQKDKKTVSFVLD